MFKASAEAIARDYHVYLMIADGHDETGTDFVSLEKNVKDAADALRQRGVVQIEAMYGVSMGGASVIRFLATEEIPVARAGHIQVDANRPPKASGPQSGSFEPDCRPAFAFFEGSVPVVLFAAIQCSDLLHFLLCQLKAKQVKVLPDVVRV